MQNGSRLAAVDLGSNSFRLEIGRMEQGQFYRTEYLKETVRQGGGLDENRNLTPDAMQRGWDCVARFGERLADFAEDEVRAVATQTLREARNREDFLNPACKLLGFPIDVISGREEARLIYLGVAQALSPDNDRRLVIDIGGRSTEIIVGSAMQPKIMESYRVGSIIWSLRYFPEGLFTKRSFQMAEIAAKAVFDEALSFCTPDQWDTAYGSAGTVNAVGDVLVAAGWPDDAITLEGLNWLLDKLITAQSTDRLRLDGMKDDRKAIIGGGVSILRALFDLLGIRKLEQATGGLRHGLLFELMGHGQPQSDLRTHSVDRLAAKFCADAVQGGRVGRVANTLFDQLNEGHPQYPPGSLERVAFKLRWAGQLHEIGSHISHTDYHKHGAYILDNADAMGFALNELHKLSLLVLGHRGKLRKLEADFGDDVFVQQLLVLRLAVVLCHARRDPDLTGISLAHDTHMQRGFVLTCLNSWSQLYPQSAHLLHEECQAWQKTPCSLTWVDA
jgi:exopolyphosphatase / guanosine-5'-triphosphate,3'-diphosphate pyrophosphatase